MTARDHLTAVRAILEGVSLSPGTMAALVKAEVERRMMSECYEQDRAREQKARTA